MKLSVTFILASYFSLSVSASTPDYIGKTFLTGQGSGAGSGIVNVGAQSLGKNRIALYFYSFPFVNLTGELDMTIDDLAQTDLEQVVVNCKDKTYSSYPISKVKQLSNAEMGYHQMGSPYKWGDYEFKKGRIGIQYQDDKNSFTKYLQEVCDM